MNWYLANNEKEYRDYALDFVDANGYGGTLWLTFSLDDGRVYLGLETRNADGDTTYIANRMYVSLAWANAIASGVDGYTMTPTTEEN